MLNPFVSCAVYAFDMLIVYVFFSRTAENTLSSFRCFIFGLLLFEVGSAINLLFQNNLWINTIVSIVIRIIFAVRCFNFRAFQAAGYSIILVVINFALELISILIISSLTNASPVDYNSNLPLMIIECSSCKILLFLTCLILSNIVVPNAHWSKHQLSLIFFPVSSSICLAIFWYICLQENISTIILYLLAFSGVVMFSSTVLLFIIYQHQIELDSERIRIKSENDKLLTEKSYYDILDQQNQQLMVYAHDTKKHLSAIQALNKDPAIEDYIYALLNQLKAYSSNCHSGNMMLDVIINKYVMECERLDLKFDYYVRTCNLNGIDDIDLVAIIGNLMDNALSSATNTKEKRISLETTVRNGYQVIVITNSCDMAPITHGGHLVTNKADKKLHGYGLKSVAKTLRKYGGDFSWEYNELTHMFIVTAMVGELQQNHSRSKV